MKYVFCALLLLSACSSTGEVANVCRSVDNLMLECVEFGYVQDRSAVFVELNHDVLVASYSSNLSTGKCSTTGSLLECPVPAREEGYRYIEISGVADVDDQTRDFLLEVQLA